MGVLMRSSSLGVVALAAVFAAALGAAPSPATKPATQPAAAPGGKPAVLLDEEKKDGFRLLFDGTTTKGWRQLGGKEFPAGWDIEDRL